MVTESLLWAITRVSTLDTNRNVLTNATGFFFEAEGNLFLVTNRHVVLNEPTNHRPASLLIDVHIDPKNVAAISAFQIPLYNQNRSVWMQCSDKEGLVDVVALRLDRAALPKTFVYQAFTPEHLVQPSDEIEVGRSVLIVGFPLGFYDTLHQLPVVRQAIVSSAFGLRFQGKGYFLTDARLHRGTSGAPVVARWLAECPKQAVLPWRLLGVHSSRVEAPDTDLSQDDRLGLNCAWYIDVLSRLIDQLPPQAASAPDLRIPTKAASKSST